MDVLGTDIESLMSQEDTIPNRSDYHLDRSGDYIFFNNRERHATHPGIKGWISHRLVVQVKNWLE